MPDAHALPFADRYTCDERMLPCIQGPTTVCCTLQLLLPDCTDNLGLSKGLVPNSNPPGTRQVVFASPPVIPYNR